ncbi:hypothetical protein B0J11DRAFT_448728, partial [Dendryphion nanum]
LRKQKRLLKKKEQKMFNNSLEIAEELERLKALEQLGQEVSLVNPEAPISAAVVN